VAFAAGILTGALATTAVGLLILRQRAPHGLNAPPGHAASAAAAVLEPAAPVASGSGNAVAGEPLDGGASDAAAMDTDGGVMTLEVADPTHAEPLELFLRAKALVAKIEKRAKFVRIVVPALQDDGTVDLSKDRSLDYRFEYAYVEPGLPAGKNTYKGRITVAATASGLRATQSPARIDETVLEHPLVDPKCPLKKAWAAVADTSVPGASGARVVYEWDPRARAGVWRFTFGNRAIGDRVVDGASCALHSGTPPSTNVKPAPPKSAKKR
jgi:hypothetical protein